MNLPDSQAAPPHRTWQTFALATLLALAFYSIDHTWDASTYVLFSADYTGAENRTEIN